MPSKELAPKQYPAIADVKKAMTAVINSELVSRRASKKLPNGERVADPNGNVYFGLPDGLEMTVNGVSGTLRCAWIALKDAAKSAAATYERTSTVAASLTPDQRKKLIAELQKGL